MAGESRREKPLTCLIQFKIKADFPLHDACIRNFRWTNHGSGLSNAYYENLADFQSGWRQRRTRNGEKWQWTNDWRDFALNSDMSMWINTEVGEGNGAIPI